MNIMYVEDNKLKNMIIDSFGRVIFDKVLADGYCDVKKLVNHNIPKDQIRSILTVEKSPFASLFLRGNAYPKSIAVAQNKMVDIIKNNDIRKDFNNITNTECYYIVFYIFKSLDIIGINAFIKETFKMWLKNKQSQDGLIYKTSDFDIRQSGGIVYDDKKVDLHIVGDIKGYMSLLSKINEKIIDCKNKICFYRGHENMSYLFLPSIFREQGWIKEEKKMYQELKIHCPTDFIDLNTHLDVLARMQHYGLPTRLLDITSNPLIALYFACENKDDNVWGEVIICEANTEEIKYPNSDTVAMLASLPIFSYIDQEKLYKLITNKQKNNELDEMIGKIIREVQNEKPGFVNKVILQDLCSKYYVLPTCNNKRIDNQSGAFIIYGLESEVYDENKYDSSMELRFKNEKNKTVICAIKNKKKLLKELNILGINKARVYPEIDDVADYLKQKYKNR